MNQSFVNELNNQSQKSSHQYQQNFLSNSHASLISHQVDKELQRILNPSESTKQLFENEFKHKIEQIQQSLTSRSNFLSLFQQMLQDQINTNRIMSQNQQDRDKFTFSSREDSELETFRIISQKQQDKGERSTLTTIDAKKSEKSETSLEDNEKISSIIRIQTNYSTQQLSKIQTNQNFAQTDSFPQITSSPIFPSSILLQSCQISKVKSQISELKHDNKKLKYYVGEIFNFLKSFLIEEIFKKGLLSIVEIVEANYEQKYMQKITEIEKKYEEMKEKCELNVNKMKEYYEKEVRKVKFFESENRSNTHLNLNAPLIQKTMTKIVSQFDKSFSHLKVAENIPCSHQQQLISFRPSSSLQNQSLSSIYSNSNSSISMNSNHESNQIHTFSNIYIKNDKNFNQGNEKHPLTEVYLNEQRIQKSKQNFSKKAQFTKKDANYQSQKVSNNQSLTIEILRKLKFTLSIPSSFLPLSYKQNPPQNSFPHENEPIFISYDCHEFSYHGYVRENLFSGYGKLVLKKVNISYEGEFQNHYMNGRGILYIVLDERIIKDKNKMLIITGNFTMNQLNGYGKIFLNQQHPRNQCFMKDKLFEQQNYQEKHLDEVFGLWKNNQLIGIV